jgi:hypothetical protein
MVLISYSSVAAELGYKSSLMFESGPRAVGGEQVGDITSLGLKLFAMDPRTHSMLFGFEYEEYDNDVPESAGLALTKHEFSAGISLQFSQPLSLKVAYSQAEYMGDDPYSAFGLYPCLRGERNGLELGLERDLAGTTFTFAQGKLEQESGTLYGGMSYERFLEGHGSSGDTEFYRRLGGGYLYSVPDTRFRLLAGANYNFTQEKPTWIMGLSHYTDRASQGINPALSVFYRIKPGSQYALGILSLWGDFGKHATTAIHEASLRGGLKRTQIIAGRNMGDPGIGSAYDANDFGLITFAASLMSVEAGSDATLVENDLTCYATYPHSALGIVRPYIGATWVKSSDLIYNPVRHTLDDPEQSLFEMKVGGKFRVGKTQENDPSFEQGFMRAELVVNNAGGASIEFQHWF